MSMLAGPRRKQKVINLRAKNNEWSKDNNKFGQRMLEKMGWTSGKGLGAKENGIVEHVVARYKNDEKGLGFEDKNDQWTKHEDDFNSLLANLSNANEDTSIKLHSGVSLEDKSKKSKARIHYHKFTRGKDLSRYSEKDLANIFGKRSFKEEQTELYQSKDDDVIIPTEQVFTEKGSMEDYFRNKLTTLKKKNKNVELNYKNLDSDYNASCGFQGFLGTTDNICDSSILIEAVNDNNVENAPKIKKKKKKKSREGTPEDLDSKNVKETFSSKGCVTEKHKLEPEHEDFEIKKQKVSKKCKQGKKKTVQSTDIEYIVEKVKKKKKRKNKDM